MSPRRLPRPRPGVSATPFDQLRANGSGNKLRANGSASRHRQKRQQSVPALNMVQRLQHRVGLELVAMLDAPLQLANPHRHPRQLGGVFVQLNAQHVVRPGHQISLPVQPQGGRVQMALVFNVLQGLEAQEQKVTAATGRVEHAVVFQVGQLAMKQILGLLKSRITRRRLEVAATG